MCVCVCVCVCVLSLSCENVCLKFEHSKFKNLRQKLWTLHSNVFFLTYVTNFFIYKNVKFSDVFFKLINLHTKSYIQFFESKSTPLAHTRLAGCAIGPFHTNSKLQPKQKEQFPRMRVLQVQFIEGTV